MKKFWVLLLLLISSVVFSFETALGTMPYWNNLHPSYKIYQEKAALHIDMEQNECAKFVNRLFKYRFDKLIWGNAWDTQLNDKNLKYLSLEWIIDFDSYDREQNFRLIDRRLRVQHFTKLYDAIESDYHRTGILGFMYRYSFAKDFLTEDVLPQTHVAFLAGKQAFVIINITNETRTIKDVLEENYGKIKDNESNFLEKKLGYSLYHILLPGQEITYQDYLIEQQFQQQIESVSLLSVFLRKHRNNRVTPILRPVSFSRITNEVFK